MLKDVSSAQLRAARAMLHLDQRELAEKAGISVPTLKRLEGGSGPLGGNFQTVSRVITALQELGVIFVAENGEGPGVRMRKSVEVNMEREKLSKDDLEAKCLAVLRRSLGLSSTVSVEVAPVRGLMSYTWDVVAIEPRPTTLTLEEALPGIRELQGRYDLAEGGVSVVGNG